MIFKEKIIIGSQKIIFFSILSCVFFIPIYFAWFQENYTVFDLNKSVALHVLLGIAITAWLTKVSLSGRIEWSGNKILLVLGLGLAISFLLSTIFSLHPIISLWGSYERQQGLYNLWHYLAIIFFILVSIQSRRQLYQLIIALLLGSAFACVYGLIQLFGLDFLRWGEEIGRLFSTFGQPNFFGHYLAVLLPLTIYAIVYIGKNIYTRFAYILLGIAEVVCLVFTYSRAAWVAVGIAGFLFLLWTLIRSGKKIVAGSLVLLFGVSVFFLTLPSTRQVITSLSASQDNKLVQRVLSTFDLSPGSARTRSVYWQAAIQSIKEEPWQQKLTGVGPDVEPDVFVRYYKTEWAFYEKMNSFPDRAHNFILDIVLQFGVLGILSFGLFAGYIIWKLVKYTWNQKDQREYWLGVSILSALTIYGINNFFSFSLTAMSVVFYSLLGMAWLVTRQYKASVTTIHFFQPTSRWLLTGAISLFIISLLYSYNLKPLIADYYYFEVKKAETRLNCRGVLDNMEKTLEWYPVSHYYSRAYISHGLNCFSEISSQAGREQQTKNLLEQVEVVSLQGKQFYTVLDLAHLYSILGEYVDKKYYIEAEKYYQELLEINPWMTFVYQDYGRMKLSEKKYDEALELFNKGIDVTPPLVTKDNQPSAWVNLSIQQLAFFYQLIGSVYYQKINFPEAVQWYEKAIETNPSLVSAYKELADLYVQWGNRSEAIKYTKKAYIIDPGNSFWPRSLALLYKEEKDYKTALTYAQYALELSPDDEAMKNLVKELENK
jgi:tetratricopeptide (TPR) repeat protein